MIQLTWFELFLLIFSVAISGCLIYGFFLTPVTEKENNPAADDEDFIDPASRKRLQAYDELEKKADSGGEIRQETVSVLQKLEKLELQVNELRSSYAQSPAPTPQPISATDNLRVLSDQEEEALIQAKEAFELSVYKAERQLEKLETTCKETQHVKAQELLKEIEARKITLRRLNGAFLQNCFSLQELNETKEELETDLEQLISEVSFLKRA